MQKLQATKRLTHGRRRYDGNTETILGREATNALSRVRPHKTTHALRRSRLTQGHRQLPREIASRQMTPRDATGPFPSPYRLSYAYPRKCLCTQRALLNSMPLYSTSCERLREEIFSNFNLSPRESSAIHSYDGSSYDSEMRHKEGSREVT